jgi:hypothetical protein
MGFSGFTRRILEEAINALNESGQEPASDNAAVIEQTKTIAELESQAADLEQKSKELRSRIATLKLKVEQRGDTKKTTSGTATSSGAR